MEEEFKNKKKDFKKTFDAEEARRKREDEDVLLRKSERAALLAKKRQYTGAASSAGQSQIPATAGGGGLGMNNGISDNIDVINTGNFDDATQQVINNNPRINPQLFGEKMGDEEAVPQLGHILLNPQSDEKELHAAVFGLRKRLSKENNPPIDLVVKHNLTSRLVELMMYTHDHKTKFECAWALTNIGSGTPEQTQAVVLANGIEAFLTILNSKAAQQHDLCEQSVWALGNIAGDGHYLRNKLLEKGLMTILQNICAAVVGVDANGNSHLPWPEHQKITILRNTIWVMSNLCRGKPSPEYETVKPAFATFAEVIGREMDDEMMQDALWGLSYLVGGTDNEDEDDKRCHQLILCGQESMDGLVVQSNKLCECIIKFIDMNTPSRKPNMEKLDYKTTKKDQDSRFRAPALRIVGTMVSAADPRIAEVLLLSGLHQPLVDILRRCTKDNMRKEAAWTISNLAAGTPKQVIQLAQKVGTYEINTDDGGTQEVPLDTFDVLTACILGPNYYPCKEHSVTGIVHPVMQQQVKKESSYALLNAINVNYLGEDREILDQLVQALVEQKQFLEVLHEVFKWEDARMVQDGLQAMDCVFEYCRLRTQAQGETGNQYVQLAESIGIQDALIGLCDKFYNSKAASRFTDDCLKAIQKWFKSEEDEHDEHLYDEALSYGDINALQMNNLQPQGGFNFGSEES